MEQQVFKLKNILLLESEFKRTPNISDSKSRRDIKINVENNLNDFDKINLYILLTLNFSQMNESLEVKEVASVIKMVGHFICPEVPNMELKDFSRINAPAIIFPFLREHLASLSIKAGITPILLDPINFITLKSEE